jgi:hypothetical protein
LHKTVLELTTHGEPAHVIIQQETAAEGAADMPLALTSEQSQSLHASQGDPVPVIDQASQKLYFIISAEQLAAVRGIMEDGDFAPQELYPLIAKTAATAGWKSSEMDEYDNYDEHQR